jgi:hypothetical protein
MLWGYDKCVHIEGPSTSRILYIMKHKMVYFKFYYSNNLSYTYFQDSNSH